MGGVSVTAGVLLGGMGLTACGGSDIAETPAVTKALALGFTAAKNLNDLEAVPEGHQVC